MKFNTEHYYRGMLINFLCKKHSFNRYLELGVDIGLTYNQIDEYISKTGVDMNPNIAKNYTSVQCCDTDTFFETNTKQFDIVLIDACHEKHQIHKDFENSFRCLSDDGIILIHDINPPDEKSTELTGFGNSFEWWVNMCEHYNLSTYVDFNNDALGIFYKNINPSLRSFINKEISYVYFHNNRNRYIYNLEMDDPL